MSLSRKIKKVMLVFPPGKVLKGHFQRCELPMGLAYLAAVLKDDFQVKVVDGRAAFKNYAPKNSKWEYFGLKPDEILDKIKEFSPDVVGITCISSFHFPEVLQLCAMIKKLNKSIITVTGGTHPTFLADRIMRDHKEIDFIVLSEGERSFKDLLVKINLGEDPKSINGLAYRENGFFKINPKTEYIENLDELPFPALELFPLDFYAKKNIPFSITSKSRKIAPVLTSRGCVANCVFCSSKNYWGRQYRMRSSGNVLDEIEFLVRKYNFKEIQFIDDNLTQDKARAERIFKGLIERNLDIQWSTPNGIAIWTLDERMLVLMKRSGCYELTVAFESGDQEVLNKIIKKPLNLEKAKKLVMKMKQIRLQVNSFFISGFPGETKEQIKRTFDFAWEMDLDSAWFFMANPTPGSELYETCIKKGYIKDDFDFENIEYGLAHIDTEDFSSKEIEKMVIYQFVFYNIGQMFRHPVRFFKKYLGIILRHPVRSFQMIWVDIMRIINR